MSSVALIIGMRCALHSFRILLKCPWALLQFPGFTPLLNGQSDKLDRAAVQESSALDLQLQIRRSISPLQ